MSSTKMSEKPLHERIIDASDRVAENAARIREYARRGEAVPDALAGERERLVAELAALEEEKRRQRRSI